MLHFSIPRNQSLICEISVWMDTGFAEKFSLGGELHIAVAEIVDILRYVNWIFRALDTNNDAMPENIGFKIKEIKVNSDITVSSRRRRRKRDEEASRHMNSVVKSIEKGMASSRCCARVAFVYTNIAPAISAATLREFSVFRSIVLCFKIIFETVDTLVNHIIIGLLWCVCVCARNFMIKVKLLQSKVIWQRLLFAGHFI